MKQLEKLRKETAKTSKEAERTAEELASKKEEHKVSHCPPQFTVWLGQTTCCSYGGVSYQCRTPSFCVHYPRKSTVPWQGPVLLMCWLACCCTSCNNCGMIVLFPYHTSPDGCRGWMTRLWRCSRLRRPPRRSWPARPSRWLPCAQSMSASRRRYPPQPLPCLMLSVLCGRTALFSALCLSADGTSHWRSSTRVPNDDISPSTGSLSSMHIAKRCAVQLDIIRETEVNISSAMADQSDSLATEKKNHKRSSDLLAKVHKKLAAQPGVLWPAFACDSVLCWILNRTCTSISRISASSRGVAFIS